MSEKICPLLFTCSEGFKTCRTDCQLWQDGDCGLKVARENRAQIIRDIFGLNADFEKLEKLGVVEPLRKKPDRYKEMWEALGKWCNSFNLSENPVLETILGEMDKIEAEMGKG